MFLYHSCLSPHKLPCILDHECRKTTIKPSSYKSYMLPLLSAKTITCRVQCYRRGGAMGHRPIQQKNGPLTTEIAILNLERMAHWNFKFIDNKWKMAHTMVCPAITLRVVLPHVKNPLLPATVITFITSITNYLVWEKLKKRSPFLYLFHMNSYECFTLHTGSLSCSWMEGKTGITAL